MSGSLHQLLDWLAPASIQLGVVLTLVIWLRPPLAWRWGLGLLVLLAPLFCPSRGLVSTVVTGISIVLACRIADLGRAKRPPWRPDLLVWLISPAVKCLPRSAAARRQNRRKAPRTFLRGALKRACWEPMGYAMTLMEPEEIPWPLRSVIVILYFVLNVTALADVLIGLFQLLGATESEVFDWPLLSTSPREFWGKRWNRFINRFALSHVALPLRGKLPAGGVVMIVFCASGLFHEYFAWGASGRKTALGLMMVFFLLQAAIVLLGLRFPPPRALPRAVRNALTAVWMTLTAPLFFRPLQVPLLEFGIPAAYFPWTGTIWQAVPGF